MSKRKRQEQLIELIHHNEISTQEELAEKLQTLGFQTTQATLSRDIKELRLKKKKNKNGIAIYKIDKEAFEFAQDLKALMKNEAILSISRVEFMIVVKTLAGFADILANTIDELDATQVLGTIAGVDTLMITCHSVQGASEFEQLLLKNEG